MRKLLYFSILLISISSFSQQTTVTEAFLEKWNNSRDYLVAVAEAMPEEAYSYKPTEREMTFEKQLLHIQENIEWLGATYFNKKESVVAISQDKKARIIQNIKYTFQSLAEAVQNTPESDLKKSVEFFAGPKSKLQILNLLQDHVTHHRGQLIVYLNLKEIEPPRYVGW